MDNDRIVGWSIGTAIAWLLFIFIAMGMYGCPRYHVWQQGLAGQAELNRAEYNRQIAIKEAEAKNQAAKSLASAEVERARGVAEANRIIGNSLAGNEAYLHYLWIDNLDKPSNQIIYVPTEAGLPVLEAGRHNTNAAAGVEK